MYLLFYTAAVCLPMVPGPVIFASVSDHSDRRFGPRQRRLYPCDLFIG